MLIEQKDTREVLRQIVFAVGTDRALHEDLTQEALIHLWLREKECPGQSRSWYLQSCRFFLQNYLRTGRSVDSARRHKAPLLPTELDQPPKASHDESPSGSSILGLVSAREIVALLQEWLTPVEQKTLLYLAEGFGVREIGTRLNISHTSVIRYRRRIATLALRLGVEPLPNKNGRQNGHAPATTQRMAEPS